MNGPAHEEVRTDNYAYRDAAVVFNEPHSGLVNYSPSAEMALKCTDNKKEDCHQHCTNEQHGAPAPLVNI